MRIIGWKAAGASKSDCDVSQSFQRTSGPFKKLESARWILANGRGHFGLSFFTQIPVLKTGDLNFIKTFFTDRVESLSEEIVHYVGNHLSQELMFQ